ncbi:LCP family protein [Candidatus Peregrinibacteria bacterium]|nr:LCP family protein [Candidatus Peregrinibacteria bacterium]
MDTIIVAHIDDRKREVRMISIPRDLFYNGRKINYLAFAYGMPELANAISKISGYQLDKYISIDMYAFIDVIDLIGGLDVHLDNALIDPTYKVEDNGVVSTLHYEPGNYHFNGKQALRVARSRHTSSDFDRAQRQQLILKAIQRKAQNFGFGDSVTIYEIIKTILSKVETDVSFDDAISYFFRYQNYKIVSNDVISSEDILYVPPYITEEECNKSIEEAKANSKQKPDCENDNHAYALLPKDDNWNIIKWYFRQKFED